MVVNVANMGHIIKLLNRRNDLCSEILRLTEEAVFDPRADEIEDEVERYTDLYDKREVLVAELIQIHGDIGNEGYAQIKAAGGEYSAMLSQSEECVKKIVEIDNRNKAAGEIMYKTARESIRRINKGRSTSLQYESVDDSGGIIIDSKN
jgi:hypothetical protein